ncbi:MAG: hypothetical protein ACRD3O_06025, partial [Terriglobia bacterium]
MNGKHNLTLVAVCLILLISGVPAGQGIVARGPRARATDAVAPVCDRCISRLYEQRYNSGPAALSVAQPGASSLLARAQQAILPAEIAAGAQSSPDPGARFGFAPLNTTPPPPEYTGKLISLDLRGVDIRDFFRLIHRVSGLNIVVDSDVTGQVTLVLDDVPWD